MDPATISALASAASSVFGLFQKKPKNPTPAQNILSQAQGVRQAAEEYGFNPLTLLQYGNPAGTGLATAGGAPPLASLEVLGSALADLTPEARADRERQRQADQLNLDLAKLKLEQARSGVVAAGLLGNTAVGVTQSPTRIVNASLDRTYRSSLVAGANSGRSGSYPVEPDKRHAVEEVHSHGQVTRVPLGPDPGEVVTGWFTDQLNKAKAFRALHTVGDGISMPLFGKSDFISDLMPPKPSVSVSDLSDTERAYLRRNGSVTHKGVRYRASEILQ